MDRDDKGHVTIKVVSSGQDTVMAYFRAYSFIV